MLVLLSLIHIYDDDDDINDDTDQDMNDDDMNDKKEKMKEKMKNEKEKMKEKMKSTKEDRKDNRGEMHEEIFNQLDSKTKEAIALLRKSYVPQFDAIKADTCLLYTSTCSIIQQFLIISIVSPSKKL